MLSGAGAGGGTVPGRLEEQQARPVLLALHRQARFYNKIFTPVREDQVSRICATTSQPFNRPSN